MDILTAAVFRLTRHLSDDVSGSLGDGLAVFPLPMSNCMFKNLPQSLKVLMKMGLYNSGYKALCLI